MRGLVTYYVLFIIELAKRIGHIAGITTQPNEDWMMQIARGLTDELSGFLIGKSHLILDRDTKYTTQFQRLIGESRTAVIRLPPRSPNLNAYAERFVSSIKEQCLNRIIFVGAGLITPCHRRVHHSLSHGAKSSRHPEPTDPARAEACDSARTRASASATRRHAQLLLWRGCVVGRLSLWTPRLCSNRRFLLRYSWPPKDKVLREVLSIAPGSNTRGSSSRGNLALSGR